MCCASTYWEGDPEECHPIGQLGEFMVSCRPGEGTTPTEGDIARWFRWQAGPRPPRDWVIVDGTVYRSVAATIAALRNRTPMPGEQAIAGDSFPPLDDDFRERVRRDWEETRRRNAARLRPE